MIGRAVEARASDIHIEPFENKLRVRYRVDGLLQEIDTPPGRLTAAIISRVKIMSKLNIAERRLPQDGRVKLALRGKEVDFRSRRFRRCTARVSSCAFSTVVARSSTSRCWA